LTGSDLYVGLDLLLAHGRPASPFGSNPPYVLPGPFELGVIRMGKSPHPKLNSIIRSVRAFTTIRSRPCACLCYCFLRRVRYAV